MTKAGTDLARRADGASSEYGGLCAAHDRIAVVTQNCELRLLRSLGRDQESTNEKLADTLVGINSLAWCGAPGYEHFLAAGGDDGTLQIWDLEPSNGSDAEKTEIIFDCRLLEVSFHADLPKLLLVLDAAGVCRLVDWLTSVTHSGAARSEAQVAIALAEPSSLAANATQGVCLPGSADWQPQDAGFIGTLLGTRWSVWNTGSTAANPTRPVATGSVSGGSETSPELSGPGGFRQVMPREIC